MDSDHENNFSLRKQVSIIKDTISVMLKNAKYGNHQDFLQNIRRINDAASRIDVQLSTGISPPSKKKYGKILVPYDDSKYSKKALAEAAGIAEEFGSELHIINVISVPTDQSPTIIQDQVNEKIKKLNRDILQSQKSHSNKVLHEKMKICKRSGVNVFCEVIAGKPAESILKFARDNKIDLIVIGSRGLTRLNKLMALGSVSRKISEEAKCPVMIIR
jgi:nucleotide-binding universal stress UspA family protein